MSKTTNFGFKTVPENEKELHVAEVFHSVAKRYDIMNDFMSLGLHRIWKKFAIEQSLVREGNRVLDIAGGTGDLSSAFLRRVGKKGEVWLTDINYSMLNEGRDKLLNQGMVLPTAQCDAEKLPFPNNYFDCVSVAFGLRNMTHKETALKEMQRVLRPGGRLIVLEFSKIWQPLQKIYDTYSFKVVPYIGSVVAKDKASYDYLVESIRLHPDQETLKQMMQRAGLEKVEYFNLSAGIVAVHRGYKF
jgi:demethylmenaquinone methyltransferase/2-methoxy-6-polyprenyl-1,4-benzoquinol methylase